MIFVHLLREVHHCKRRENERLYGTYEYGVTQPDKERDATEDSYTQQEGDQNLTCKDVTEQTQRKRQRLNDELLENVNRVQECMFQPTAKALLDSQIVRV